MLLVLTSESCCLFKHPNHAARSRTAGATGWWWVQWAQHDDGGFSGRNMMMMVVFQPAQHGDGVVSGGTA
jgi:hypothetical protein